MAIPGNIRVKADGKHEIALMRKLRHLLSPKEAWTSLPQVAPCPPAPFHRRWPPQRFACAYRCKVRLLQRKTKETATLSAEIRSILLAQNTQALCM